MYRIVLAALLLLALPVTAADWPQWQGPDRNAISKETGLLQTWPKGGPKLLWSINTLGDGYGTPTVSAGSIYTMGNRDGKEWIFALNETDGKERWAIEVGAVRAKGGGYAGPRCSPTVDGNLLYALGMNGDLLCVDVSRGATAGGVLWRKDLSKDFGGKVGGWAYSESPLIDGDQVIVTPGGENTLVSLNKKTGELIWKGKVPSKDGAHYASAVLADIHGVKQVVQFLSGGVVGIDAKDGTFLWRYNKPANGTANCSSPIVHNNHVFAASSYGTGGGLAKITREGQTWKAEEVYFTRQMKNHHGGMVLHDGCLYGSDEGSLTCLDFMTGKERWAVRKGKGSILVADNRIYYRDESGPMMLIELSPEKCTEVGRLEQPKRSGKNTWPHPIIANGRLYLRDQDALYCYDVKGQ